MILFASIASHKIAAAMALSARFMKSGSSFLKVRGDEGSLERMAAFNVLSSSCTPLSPSRMTA